MSDLQLEPGRWWRVLYRVDDGWQLWCETSDEQEARDSIGTAPSATILQRIYQATVREWRNEQ